MGREFQTIKIFIHICFLKNCLYNEEIWWTLTSSVEQTDTIQFLIYLERHIIYGTKKNSGKFKLKVTLQSNWLEHFKNSNAMKYQKGGGMGRVNKEYQKDMQLNSLYNLWLDHGSKKKHFEQENLKMDYALEIL